MKRFTLPILLLTALISAKAQNIAINTSGNTALDCAILDVTSSTLGVLIPRISIGATGTYGLSGTAANANSMLVYNTNAAITGIGASGVGFYYWSTGVSRWINLIDNLPSGAWMLAGNNSITTPAVPVTYGTSTIGASENWMGTTDAQDIVFGTSNIERMRVDKTTGNLVLGSATPSASRRIYSTTSTTTADGAGVWGEATATATRVYGVFGSINSSSALSAAVRGYSNATTGQTGGVWGENKSSGGYGVAGLNTSTTAGGSYYGVYGSKEGNTTTGTGYAIYGTATNTAATNIGGYFTATGATNNYGIIVPSGGGSVGIGITAPTAKLHVSWGDIGVGRIDGGDDTPYARFGLSNGWEQYLANNAYYNAGVGAYYYVNTAGYGGTASVINQISGTINLQTTSGGTNPITWNSRVYVTNPGYVGIGTTGPMHKLDVQGRMNVEDGVIQRGGAAITTTSDLGLYSRYAGNWMRFVTNAAAIKFYSDDGTGTNWNMTIETDGKVGIGTNITPGNKLHVVETAVLSTSYFDNTNPASFAAVYGRNTAAAGTDGGYGIAGRSAQDGTAVGWGGGAILAQNSSTGGYGIIGVSNGLTNYDQAPPTGTGAGANFRGTRYGAYITQSDGATSGTGYLSGETYAAIKSNNALSTAGHTYHFGVHGSGFLGLAGTTRIGAVLGNRESGEWACLGYRSSTPTNYALYATAALTTGTGRLSSGAFTPSGSIAIGSYGDLMGAWIRGNIYGMNISGGRYSMYIDGKTFTNDVIAQMSSNPGSTTRTVTYVPTSTSVDVYAKGTAQMMNGKATIRFDEGFKNIISDKNLPVVTVTPMGSSNGVYIESVTSTGFTIVENGNGNSTVAISWIAIGTKKGYENPTNPEELLSTDYDKNMNEVMFNENNLEGSGKPIWWDGTKLRFDPMPLELGVEKVTPPVLIKISKEEANKGGTR